MDANCRSILFVTFFSLLSQIVVHVSKNDIKNNIPCALICIFSCFFIFQ